MNPSHLKEITRSLLCSITYFMNFRVTSSLSMLQLLMKIQGLYYWCTASLFCGLFCYFPVTKCFFRHGSILRLFSMPFSSVNLWHADWQHVGVIILESIIFVAACCSSTPHDRRTSKGGGKYRPFPQSNTPQVIAGCSVLCLTGT